MDPSAAGFPGIALHRKADQLSCEEITDAVDGVKVIGRLQANYSAVPEHGNFSPISDVWNGKIPFDAGEASSLAVRR